MAARGLAHRAAPWAELLIWTTGALVLGHATEAVAHPSAFCSFLAAVGAVSWRRGLRLGLVTAMLSAPALTWLVRVPGAEPPSAMLALSIRLLMFAAAAVLLSRLRESRRATRAREEKLAALNARLGRQAAELADQVRQGVELTHRLEWANSELADVAKRAEHDRAGALALARRKEEALAVLDTLLASSPIGFAYVDTDLRYVVVNRELARLHGLDMDAHAGLSLHDAIPELAATVESYLRRVLAEGVPLVGIELEWRERQNARRSRSSLASYYPVHDGEGAILGVGVIVVDITERKLLEAQLRQAQKMEAVGRLAGGIAHDFNNVLTAIKSYSQILQQELPAGDARAADAREIGKAADRAAALTRQLLAFSRKQVLQPRVLDLNAVVTEMQRMLTRLIGEDIELVPRLDPNLGAVRADPGQIEQVVMNLVLNARDAMPHGGVLLLETENATLGGADLAPAPDLAAGAYVRLSVQDTGVGMDEETLARVFEPFFTTKEQGRGTGLGLSTVYGIVKQSGGDLRVASMRGMGTCVEIFLPQVETAAAVPVAAGDGAPAPPDGSETILLVEDDDMLRPLMRRVLEKQGYAVLEARHGVEAVQVAEAHHDAVHLLITDVVMPEMGGRELAERLAAARPAMRVLFVSGYTDDVVLRAGVLDARTAFLQKPFTPADLVRTARAMIAGRA